MAAPIVAEVLVGIRDASEYTARESDFRALAHVTVEGDAGCTAARIGRALAETGKTAKTIDLLLAAGAIHAGAELWSLRDDHYEEIRRILRTPALRSAGILHVRRLA